MFHSSTNKYHQATHTMWNLLIHIKYLPLTDGQCLSVKAQVCSEENKGRGQSQKHQIRQHNKNDFTYLKWFLKDTVKKKLMTDGIDNHIMFNNIMDIIGLVLSRVAYWQESNDMIWIRGYSTIYCDIITKVIYWFFFFISNRKML